jgi:hypothetical protein
VTGVTEPPPSRSSILGFVDAELWMYSRSDVEPTKTRMELADEEN